MGEQNRKLKVVFLPYFTTSHLIPMVDTARLFAASHGVAATIITTPKNAQLFRNSVDRDFASGREISVQALKLPSAEVGLAEGIENFGQCTSGEMMGKLGYAIGLLQKPMEQLIREIRPDCVVSDMFFPWTVELAEEMEVPRILFYPSNAFYHCVSHSLKTYAPHQKVQSDTETFVVPNLPDKIEMSRSQLQDHMIKTNTMYGELINTIKESEIRSHGIIFTSFIELEPNYVDHFKKVRGIKCWHVGLPSHFIEKNNPVDEEDTEERDLKEDLFPKSIKERHYSLSWLDTQKPNSVIYVCFGSMIRFPDTQLTEIALALEASGASFVWVVRKNAKSEGQEDESDNWLPKGFEEKVKETRKGLIIRDWAPQKKILNHPAVGGFMTHCGWNSVLEAVVTGVPLITWPMFAEQFYNEKLITQVLGIGVEVGSDVWNSGFEIKTPVVGNDKIRKAITCLMEADVIRLRAKELGEMANKSVEEGGSSYSDLNGLVGELKAIAFGKA